MKLQLNHIQYYPIGKNGLKLLDEYDNAIVTFYGIDVAEKEVLCKKNIIHRRYLSEVKPILHPLSDLTKPIKVEGYNDGEEFVPIVELAKIGNRWIIEDGLEDRIYFNPWDTGVCEVFVRTASPEDPRIFIFEIYDYLTQPYRIIQKLFQWHFAVDIPDETWIDINTLNK